MSFSNIFEHSKKIGRILALTIILGVAGTISIISTCKDPANAGNIVDDWLKLAGVAVTFYFLTAPKNPEDKGG